MSFEPPHAPPDDFADLAVCVRGVTKEFGRGTAATRALRGVDLDVPYGELLMLVGPSVVFPQPLGPTSISSSP